jgi:phage tail-like protein
MEYVIQLRVTTPEGTTELFVVPQGISTIGRQEGNALRLDNALISRQHARLECTAAACLVTDLGSANGTYLNGERLTPDAPTPLLHGSVLEIGPYRLAYEQIPIAPAAAASPPASPPGPPAEKRAKQPAKRPVAKPAAPREADKAAPLPPAPPSLPPASLAPVPPHEPDYSQPPPGLGYHSDRLIHYLPGIYHNDFVSRFLGIFESVITPIEWNIDNFDLFLDPDTAPDAFLPWLANWFDNDFDDTWSPERQRLLLREAGEIYARRGTRWALSRVLEIYTGCTPVILDTGDDLEPYTFVVKLAMPESLVDRGLVERLIDSHKPAHTNYRLELMPG